MSQTRLIMYHKQATSARTRFLRLGYGGVCGFEPMPTLSSLLELANDEDVVLSHPGALVHQAEQRLGMSSGSLEAQGGYRARVDVPGGMIEVFLARFTTTDPPFEVADAIGGAFVDLAEARGVPPFELSLLRGAYEYILGG